MKRAIVLIIDGGGIGSQEDYLNYHSFSTNTIGNVINTTGISLPSLNKLGLSYLLGGEQKVVIPVRYGKLRENSAGNDSYAGMMNLLGYPFPQRFPSVKGLEKDELLKLEECCGCWFLGNESILGYHAIDKNFDSNLKTGFPILNFGNDGVLMVASHQDVISVDNLNQLARKIQQFYVGSDEIARIISLPYKGDKSNIERIPNRVELVTNHQFLQETIIPKLFQNGIGFYCTSLIQEVIGEHGGEVLKGTFSNGEILDILTDRLETSSKSELIFLSLKEFDTAGHKKDVQLFADRLLQLDEYIPNILYTLNDDDLLIITGDHGCDPSQVEGRGHTREFTPYIEYNRQYSSSEDIGVEDFSYVSRRILTYFDLT